ncbi:MAG: polysaccharide biosynthesis tyrosine autokinase [Candidatus Sericytochromatia bacterium]|nr:polysaccharide biosynthesis tyrosine autokinase [Candidatus Sericytochromatia bacterium]
MELKQYWQILWKRRWWVLLAFLLVVVTTGAITFTTAPVYQASTKLLIEQRDRTLSALGSEMANMTELSSLSRTGSPLDTQAELLRSVPVIARVIKRVNLTDAETGNLIATEDFLGAARVTQIKGTDILQISYVHTDPIVATQVSDVWAQVFLEQNRQANRTEASSAARFIQGQLQKTKRELAEAEQALRDYKAAHGAVDLTEEARTSVQTMANMEAELRQATAAKNEAASRVAAMRSKLGMSAQEAMTSSAISQDQTIQKLRGQLLELETSPVLSNASLTPNHPEVKAIQAQISVIRRALAQEAAEVVGRRYGSDSVRSNMDPIRQGLTKELVAAEIDALGFQTRVDSLSRVVGGFNGRLASLPNKELNLTRLMRNASVTAELYKMLLQKHEEARIQEAMNVGNVRIVEEAVLPERPIRPKKAQNMMLAVLVGLLGGIGLAMFLEYLDDSIQTVDDAEDAVQLTTLGIIPWVRDNEAARLIALSDPRSPASESYRTLRTNIKFLSADKPLRTLTVTSAGPEEGKSTTIANMGVSFAQSGKRTLIVDTDMRKPTVHTIFKLSNREGVSSVLTGERTLEECIRATDQPGLFVLTCGPTPPNPAELLESQRMLNLIEDLKAQFDLVLFDAPPIIAVTDASVLGARLDGLLLLMGINKVTRKASRHALSLLSRANVKVWGMVVRGVRPDNDGYYYSYYHKYYGKVDNRHDKTLPTPAPAPAARGGGEPSDA